MPTFIIHELGKPGDVRSVDLDEIRIGRDTKSDLVLNHRSVSRKQAAVRKREDGEWILEPLSSTSPRIGFSKCMPSRDSA